MQERAAPVVDGGSPDHIAKGDQGLDQLADSLLGDLQTGHEITATEPRLRLGECTHGPDAPLGRSPNPLASSPADMGDA